MSATQTAGDTPAFLPNSEIYVRINVADLPLHCPRPGAPLWNSHPRVFLPFQADGKAKCPYCGTEFELID